MSRPPKQMPSEPLGAYLTHAFMAFARGWPDVKDFDRLAISFAPNGYPIVGRCDLLSILFRVASMPEKIESNSEDERMFLVCYRRAPDFVLGLLVHLREKLHKASPHRKYILFSADHQVSPKAVKANLNAATQLDTVKAERRRLRKVCTGVRTKKKEAEKYQHNEITINLNPPAS